MNIFLQVCRYMFIFVRIVVSVKEIDNAQTEVYKVKSYNKVGLRPPIAISYETVEITKLFNNQTLCVSRICIADDNGEIIFDKIVKPLQVITDYRTNVTGITQDDIMSGEDFYIVRSNILEIITWRIIIGYKIVDFLALMKMRHPLHLLRDTSYFTRCSSQSSCDDLEIEYLAKTLQKTDLKYNDTRGRAKILMELYKQYQHQWEMFISDRHHVSSIAYALDCQTVYGENHNKRVHVAVQISIVDFNGMIVFDRLFKPDYPITDYRSNITNLYENNFTQSEYLYHSAKTIRSIIKGNILVGHELSHHLKFLDFQHPFPLRRDTSSYRPFLFAIPNKPTPTLKDLAQLFLNKTIENNYRDTIENAQTAMKLYTKFKREWDAEIRNMYQVYNTHKKMQGKRRDNSPLAINYGRVLTYNMERKLKLIGRVTIVDENKTCVFEKFVQPKILSTVVDCFTKTTGITYEDLRNGTPKIIVRKELVDLLEDRIIIGYNLNYFLSYFRLDIDLWNQRDISIYTDFYSPINTLQTVYKITMQFLNVRLYRNSSSLTRASIFMDLYNKYKDDWDISIAQMVTNMKTNALNSVLVSKKEELVGDPLSLQCSLVVEYAYGFRGHNIIGRIVIVDKNTNCIYDKYIKQNPSRPIIDFRTNITGIQREHLALGSQYYTVVSEVTRITQNKVIVGEQLYKCIHLLPHKAINQKLVRDINQFSMFKRDYLGFFSLNNVCKKYMGYKLRDERDPIERAQLLMAIYKKYGDKWELEIQKKLNKNRLRFRTTFLPTPWYNRTRLNTFLV